MTIPFQTQIPALLFFIKRRSPKAKRVSNLSAKRSLTQGTVGAGWGNIAHTGRKGQHVQESRWHQSEDIWKPSTSRSCHVTVWSVCSTLSSLPASLLRCQLLSGCPGFASSLASTPATGNICYSPKPSYKLAACTVFAPGRSLRLCPLLSPPPSSTVTLFEINTSLPFSLPPPAHSACSQPCRNRSLCSGGYFLPVVGLVRTISGCSVPTSSLVSRLSFPSPHPPSGPGFRCHSNNLIPV